MSGIVIDMELTQPLTSKQKAILKYIHSCTKSRSLPPTIREIAEKFSLSSTATVRDHLKALVKKGYLKIQENKSRGIELIREKLFKVPVLGRVRAGMPAFAVEDLEGFLDLDDVILPDENVFALRVKGDSMMEAGIIEGDFILVKKQEFAQHGDIIVALIGEDTTVKKLIKKSDRYYLEPANPKYQPIPVTADVSIIGKVIHVIRKY